MMFFTQYFLNFMFLEKKKDLWNIRHWGTSGIGKTEIKQSPSKEDLKLILWLDKLFRG